MTNDKGDSNNSVSVWELDVQGPDRQGLVNEVSDILYQFGANLADASFVVLGDGCRFTVLAEFLEPIDGGELANRLGQVELLEGMRIHLQPFEASLMRKETAFITHRLYIEGGDKPGLVQRISEVIVEHGANIVRLNSHRAEHDSGTRYVTRFALHIPANQLAGLDNAISNVAGTLRLQARLIEEA